MSWVSRWDLRSTLLTVLVVLGVALPARWIFDRLQVASPNDQAVTSLGSAAGTDRLIEAVSARLASGRGEAFTYSLLGAAYLQKARETGDPNLYSRAHAVLKKALDMDPHDVDALTGMGLLSLARHEFQGALVWGEQAHRTAPNNVHAYGILGDAYVELGRYEEAWQAFQRMVDLRPDLSSYSRVSYARELTGDTAAAIEAMKLAVTAGGPNTENVNWARVQLGHLYFSTGDLPAAEAEYLKALAVVPSYIHAQAGLARVLAAQGKTAEATSLYVETTERVPIPEYLIALGDLHWAAGRAEEAAKAYELVELQQRLYQAIGVNTDLEMALFNVDRSRSLADALRQARQEYEKRPSIFAADVLAWALYKNGESREAAQYSKEALQLGTKNALMLFHAGMIQHRLGHLAEARWFLEEALSLNPHFSLRYRDEAFRTLEALRAIS